MGIALFESGQKEEACACFSRAIELGFTILRKAEHDKCAYFSELGQLVLKEIEYELENQEKQRTRFALPVNHLFTRLNREYYVMDASPFAPSLIILKSGRLRKGI